MKRLSIKQRQILNKYIETGNGTKTGIEVGGYSSKNSAAVCANRMLKRHNVRHHMEQALEAQGLSISQIANNLKQLTRAKKLTPIIHQGTVTDTFESPDNTVRLQANKLAGIYHGLEDKTGTSPSTVRIDNLNIDMSKLSNEELNEIIARGQAVNAEYSVEGIK